MNNHFKNIEINDDIELKMNIYNLDTCIVNSFRRIVLSDVISNAFDKIIQVNLKSSIWLVNEASHYMKKNTGCSVIVMSSISAIIGTNDIGAYGISKAAEVALVRNLAVELGPKGIRVNAIAPGLIKTDSEKCIPRKRSNWLPKDLGNTCPLLTTWTQNIVFLW